jgi:hypothetical protein
VAVRVSAHGVRKRAAWNYAISIRHQASASVLIAQSGVDVAHPGANQKEAGVMSQAGVGTVVEELLTDENLRVRFALDPMETVADLFLRGVDLTGDEIELLCRADAGVWFLRSAVSGAPQH